MHELRIQTRKRNEFLNITALIAEKVRDLSSGYCLVFCPHTTAGLTINENADPAVCRDILSHLEEIIPADKEYLHLEGNADSHIKASLMGSSLQIIVEQGKPVLGTWQGIYFCEFDGPRSRKVYIKVIKE